MSYFKKFFLLLIIFFSTSIFGSFLVVKKELETYNIEKTSGIENKSIDSIDVGDDITRIASSDRKKYIVDYHFQSRTPIVGKEKTNYEIHAVVENVLGSPPSKKISFVIDEANYARESYEEQTFIFALFGGDQRNIDFSFEVPNDAHIKISSFLVYNNVKVYTGPIFLMPFDPPTIENIDVIKDIYTPRIINITWDFVGKSDFIIPEETKIQGTGIKDGGIQLDPRDETVTIDALDYETTYDDWELLLSYNSGFIDETTSKINMIALPSFLTYKEDMDLIPSFTYGEEKNDKLTVEMKVQNLSGSEFKYTNFTFISLNAKLMDSRKVLIVDDGNYKFENIPLTTEVYDDFQVQITVEDPYNTLSYVVALPAFTKGPTISNLSEVIDPVDTSITLTWKIKDKVGLFTTFYLYDETKDSMIKVLSPTEVASQTLIITGLDGDLDLEWTIRGDWVSTNDSGTAISNNITFTTLWKHAITPTINSFKYSNVKSNGVDVSWKLEDEQKVITRVYLYDENTSTIFHVMTPSELASEMYVATSLTPKKDYRWTLRVEWDDPHFGEEMTVISNSIAFTTLREQFDIPTINSFSYKNLSYGVVTIDWSITDIDNILTNVFLYDLDNEVVFFNIADWTTDSMILNDLVEGKTYNLELCANWVDPIYASGEITSENKITFTVPYTPKEIPQINSFTYENLTYGKVTLKWTLTDLDDILESVFVFDVTNNEVYKNVLDWNSGKIVLTNLIEGETYNFELRGKWKDPHYSSGEIKSTSIEFVVPYTPRVKPTIDSFTYDELTYQGIMLQWTLTDLDNTLNELYLYDLTNDQVFQNLSEIKSGEVYLDNLIEGQTYTLELRGEWKDPHYPTTTITSQSPVTFRIPYKHMKAPWIETFIIVDETQEEVILSWAYKDLDNVVTEVFIYDEQTQENIYQLSKADLLSGTVTLPNEGRVGKQDWTLKIHWYDVHYGAEVVTSDTNEFVIPGRNSNFLIFILFISFLILFLILLVVFIIYFETKRKSKANEIKKMLKERK